MTNYEKWQEVLRQIAEYDWAVEGAQAPAGAPPRAQAIRIRNRLVEVAKEIRA